MKDDLLLDRHLPGLGDSKMSENQTKPNLIDTTDCLEAVEVFKGWKNFLFVIVLICLLILQGIFWLVDTGSVKTSDDNAQSVVAESVIEISAPINNDKPVSPVIEPAVELAEQAEQAVEDVNSENPENTIDELKAAGLEVPEDISMAAKDVVAEPNQAKATEKTPAKKHFNISLKITAGQIQKVLQFVNFVLIISAILYCLTLLFTLKVSLLGRLGGINHISRAFFLSFFMCVFLLPWQNLFGPMVSGFMFSSEYLIKCYTDDKTADIFSMSLYYLRFVGYWLWVVILLICAQLRGRRWARAILRRLEVI